MLIVIAPDIGVYVVAIHIMKIVSHNHVTSSSSRYINAVTITKGLHDGMDLVKLQYVIATMKELLALLPGKLTWPIREDAINFLPTYCFGALTLTVSYPDDAATYNNCRIGSVVDQIVSDPIFATLPDEYCR